jgi:hypothetical protein
VCAFVAVVAVVVWASSGLFSGTQLQTLFSSYLFFLKREGFFVKKSQQVCLSLSSCCVAFLSEPQKKQKQKKKKKQRVGGFSKTERGKEKKSGNNLRLFCERFGLLFFFLQWGDHACSQCSHRHTQTLSLSHTHNLC